MASQDFAEAARNALTQATRRAGLPADGWSTVRIGERAVYRLQGQVAKVARNRSRFPYARREVLVARWLGAEGIPVEQPLPIDCPDEEVDLPVTFWHVADGAWTTPNRLAGVLQDMHKLLPPDALGIPRLNPFPRMRQRLAGVANLDVASRQLLEQMAEHYEPQFFAALAADGSSDVILHGDANIGNILEASNGDLALLDLEGVCIGRAAWDLMITAVYRDLGWHTDDEYAAFCDVYGHDVTHDPEWNVLRAVQELRMTCWLAQKAASDQAIAEEFANRVADLGDPDRPRRWHPY